MNPYKFSVGEGLGKWNKIVNRRRFFAVYEHANISFAGLPGYRADEPDHRQMKDAVRLSEDLEIEQTMFEDKLKTTDWEATNEAIEEQIARESYLQWCRDMQKQQKQPQKQLGTSSSTVTSSEIKGEQSPNRSSGESSFESEEQYPSDEEHGDYNSGACSSSSKTPGTLFYVQQHQQRRRKRKRFTVPVCSAAGPSTDEASASNCGKNIKVLRRNTVQPEGESCVPGPSKSSPVKVDAPMSDFYQSLLESSYSADVSDVEQMTEDKMLQKALQMSRMDFMKQLQQQKTDDPPSP